MVIFLNNINIIWINLIDVVDSESVRIRIFMYIGFIEGVIIFIIFRWIGLVVVSWIFVCIIVYNI